MKRGKIIYHKRTYFTISHYFALTTARPANAASVQAILCSYPVYLRGESPRAAAGAQPPAANRRRSRHQQQERAGRHSSRAPDPDKRGYTTSTSRDL